MQKTNNLFYAKAFHELGLNVTNVVKYLSPYNFRQKNILKSPANEWEKFITERQSLEELESYDWENSTGIGTVLGFKNIRAIDVDGCISYNLIIKLLRKLGLPGSYEWVIKSGSHNGYHILVECEDDKTVVGKDGLRAYKANESYEFLFDKLEFRWKGHIVLPPSIHISSLQYEFVYEFFPKNMPKKIEANKLKEILKEFVHKEPIDGLLSGLPIEGDKQFKNTLPNSIYYGLGYNDHSLIQCLVFDARIINNSLKQIAWAIYNFESIIMPETYLIREEGQSNYKGIKVNASNVNVVAYDKYFVLERFLNVIKGCTHLISYDASNKLKFITNELRSHGLQDAVNELDRQVISIEDYYDRGSQRELSLRDLYRHNFKGRIKHGIRITSDYNAITECSIIAKIFSDIEAIL
ncbi:MAG: hypothetical protein FH748_05955 [Balneolaceae bacterium]|nr:hypothetical protein [Balneolaceae bacterium]